MFAAAIGAEPGAVRMMKHRNRIPRSVWPEVVAAFPDLTLEVLKASERLDGRPSAADALRLARAS